MIMSTLCMPLPRWLLIPRVCETGYRPQMKSIVQEQHHCFDRNLIEFLISSLNAVLRRTFKILPDIVRQTIAKQFIFVRKWRLKTDGSALQKDQVLTTLFVELLFC